MIGLRLAEGRCGSTLLMNLLATDRRVVFDRKYPAEYRYLSYFARMAAGMTEPFDPEVHRGVTPFFFGPEPELGPIPFTSDVVDRGALPASLLPGLWSGWSAAALEAQPGAVFYAEKLAVPVAEIEAAGIAIGVIDLVRDPRDMLASIKAFTANGIDGFGRTPGQPVDDQVYAARFAETVARALERSGSGLVVRYEDLVDDLDGEARRLSDWSDTKFGHALDIDPSRVVDATERHATSSSPAASIGRWREELPTAEAKIVTARLAPVMARFGYDLHAAS